MSTMVAGHWLPSNHADQRAIGLYLRHYSARHYRDGRKRTQFCPPGEKMVMLTELCDAVFVWHRPNMERLSGQAGVCCTLFRNEGTVLSSELIREACELAWQRWPGERLFTYVAAAKIRSTNPGYCFKQAGFKRCGRNADGRLTILELLPVSKVTECSCKDKCVEFPCPSCPICASAEPEQVNASALSPVG